MRTNFQEQQAIGGILIENVRIPEITRDELPPVLKGLQYIFVTKDLHEKVFAILRESIGNVDVNKGRRGMTLWEILILAVIRNSLDTDYDRLHDLANHHSLVRQVMGIYSDFGFQPAREFFGLQTIKDNVKLISEDLINRINVLVVEAGHSLVKKNEDEKLNVCVDTYALESNVHFPTDLNLLWDSIRKTICLIVWFADKWDLKGWRKSKFWLRELKSIFRLSSRVHGSGGKNKEERLKTVVNLYLKLSKSVLTKSLESIKVIESSGAIDVEYLKKTAELNYYKDMLVKHIDLVERRIIKDEKIPASEKIVSIFEEHTEWLQKGKSGRKKVEFGHNLLIATDQYQFIVYYKVIEGQYDVDLTIETIDALYEKYPNKLASASFDKGFSSKKVKEELIESGKVDKLILPKRGKLSAKDKEEESDVEYKKLRNKHSRVESDINRLEHNGLNTCLDKGLGNFKRYASLGILSYNLHNLGKILIEASIKEEKKKKVKANSK